MTEKESLEIAAEAWCHPETKRTVVDVNLAHVFARILRREVNAVSKPTLTGNPFYNK